MNIARHCQPTAHFRDDRDRKAASLHVELSNIGWTATNGSRILDHVNLALNCGEFVSIVGPSGSGKSSLLRLISGLQQPSTGKVILYSDNKQSKGSRISFVFQDATLMPWADVQSNVRLPLELRKWPQNEIDKKVEEVLGFINLEQAGHLYPDQMSGGMKMRASIARALITDPDLLLMDEPFGALDEQNRARLDEDLLRLSRERKMTVLFVTHSVYEAAFLSDRVLVMASHPGKLVDEISIEGPALRDQSFRMSPIFFEACARIQKSLASSIGKETNAYV
jgi:NitT/TauT family transport system ATP-binding protein